MSRAQNRSIVPFILIAIGVLFLAGAVISVLLISSPEGGSNIDGSDSAGNDLQVARVDLSQAKAAFDDGSAVFVDVRDKAYFDSGHIPGAKSIPLSEIEERHGELNREDWIILYCTWPNEETSARAASILINYGFQRANPVLGGLQDWSEAGYPIEP